MRATFLRIGCSIFWAYVVVVAQDVLWAATSSANWRELAEAGDYPGALRELDSARSAVVKEYATAIKQSLPKRIAGLEGGKLEDGTGYLEIATQQTYAGAGKEIRIDLQVPILNVNQTMRNQAGAVQFIKAMLGNNKRSVTDQMEYLIQQGFAAQIRRDSIFAARPQFMAYLSNGATITIHAMSDIPIDEFKKMVGEVPLKKIDKVIGGGREKP